MLIEVGMTFETTRSGTVKVLGYRGSKDVLVEFLNTGNTKTTTSQNLRSGMVLDKEATKAANRSRLNKKRRARYVMMLVDGETFMGNTYLDLSTSSGIPLDTVKSFASSRVNSRIIHTISSI